MTAKVPIGSLRSPEEIRRALLGLYESLKSLESVTLVTESESRSYIDERDAYYHAAAQLYADQQDIAHSIIDQAYTDARITGPTGPDLEALIAAANTLILEGSFENSDLFASDLIVARHILSGSVTGAHLRATGSVAVGGDASRIEIIGSDLPATTSIRAVTGPPMQLNDPQGSWDGIGVPTPTARTSYNNGVVIEDIAGYGLQVLGERLVDYADTVDGWLQFPFTDGAITFGVNDLDGLAPDATIFTATSGQEVAMVHGETLVVHDGHFVTYNGSFVEDT